MLLREANAVHEEGAEEENWIINKIPLSHSLDYVE
jgi:hypothetical protein